MYFVVNRAGRLRVVQKPRSREPVFAQRATWEECLGWIADDARTSGIVRTGTASAGTMRGKGSAHDADRRTVEALARNKRDGKRRGHPTGIHRTTVREGFGALDDIAYGTRANKSQGVEAESKDGPSVQYDTEGQWFGVDNRAQNRRLSEAETLALSE